MSTIENGRACAIADPSTRELLARVDVPAAPAVVFRALTSSEITRWWVRPGVFDTREWTGVVRVGGQWRTSGIFRGQPYTQHGEYLEIDTPRRLVMTLQGGGEPDARTIVTCTLEPIEDGTRLMIRQSGFATAERCQAFALGWETSFEQLAEMLTPEFAADQ